jgi:hypothetical protein
MKCEFNQEIKIIVMNHTTKHIMVVKEETDDITKPVQLGAKAHLTELPTVEDNQQLGPHQFAARLFNAEVNLISDWVVAHKPQLVKHKWYICRC